MNFSDDPSLDALVAARDVEEYGSIRYLLICHMLLLETILMLPSKAWSKYQASRFSAGNKRCEWWPS